MGVDWVGSPRARPLPSQAAEISPASEGRWLDRKAQAVQDRVEISDQGRNRAMDGRKAASGNPSEPVQAPETIRSEKPVRSAERPSAPSRVATEPAVVQPVDAYVPAQASPVQVAASAPATQVAEIALPAVDSPGKVSSQAISAYSQGARPVSEVSSRVWIG
jgi:hypothetical protein